jgi:hypothetical protein
LPGSNINYGGSIENRARVTMEAATAIAEQIGPHKRVIRGYSGLFGVIRGYSGLFGVIRTGFSLFVFPDR